jgi:hypothetical protein
MANLSDDDRVKVWKEFMAQTSAAHEGFAAPLTKADVRAAVDGIDQWLTDNASSGNQAIPQPARSGLSTAQKARLQSIIVLQRWGSGV